MPLSLRRTIRWLRRTLIILIVFLGILAALFMTSTVQTWAARRVASVLHAELGLDVSLGRLQYSFPNRVVLRDVLLRDDQQDTVIGIGFMSTRIDLVNSKASRIQLGRTNFQDLWLYLHKHEGDSINGFAQFIKKFKRDEDREKKDFFMDIRSVHIERMRFHLLDETCSDCFHLLWPKAELNARKVMIYPDSISADIQHLSFNDPERFDLKHMEAQAHYAARSSALNNWLMVTDSSRLSGSAQLAYDSTSAFRSFIDEVSFKLELIDSRLDLREGHRFLPAIPALPAMQIELQASGKLNELDIESLELLDGKRTQLAMSGSMRDIQTEKGPALDLQIEDLSTYVKALPRYLEPLQTTIALPSFMDSLNLLEASGQLTRSGNTYGYTGKLEAKGLGLAEPDIELQLEPNSNRGHRLSGGLRFESLNLHLLSENNSLQSASGVVRMDVRLPKGKIPEGRIKAALTDLGAMDRQFGGIQVEGAIENQSFTGALHVIDPKVEFHFFGTADLGAGVRGYDFKAHLKKLDLAQLGLVDDSVGNLAARVELKAAGVFPEDWDGELRLYDVTYENPMNFFFFNELKALAEDQDSTRHIKVRSDLFTADIEGRFRFQNLFAFAKAYTDRYSGRKDATAKRLIGSTRMELELQRPEFINQLLIPKLQIEAGTKLTAEYREEQDELKLNLQSNGIQYGSVGAENINIRNRKDTNGLDLRLEEFYFDNESFENLALKTEKVGDSVSLELSGTLIDTVNSTFDLGVYFSRPTDSSYRFSLQPGVFSYGNYKLRTERKGFVRIRPSNIEIHDVSLMGNQGMLHANGFVSRSPYQILRLQFDEFDLGIFNPFLGIYNTRLNGRIGGEVIASQLLNDPRYGLEMIAPSLTLNNVELGRVRLYSAWSLYTGAIDLDGSIRLGELEKFNLNGRFYPDSLYADVSVEMKRLELALVQPYVEGIFANLRGFAEGDVTFCGKLGEMGIDGAFELPQAAFTIPFLNTDYSLQGSPKLLVNEQRIWLDTTVIRDTEEGTRGVANLLIDHEHFRELELDLQIDADRLLSMNTTSAQSPFYYGTVYGSGLITLKGPFDDLKLNVDARADRGTVFSIPMGGPKEVVGSSFITFKEPDRFLLEVLEEERSRYRVNRNNNPMSLYFDLDVTPEAELEIIIDEQTGDMLRGKGKGQIQLQIDKEGDVQMLGGVEVESGYYNFTLTGIVGRKFNLIKGGSIRWNGTPYDSEIDLQAVYNTRVSLGPLLEEYKGVRTDLDLYLNLRGELMNPSITFDIKTPQATSDAQVKLDNFFADKDRLNRQAFSILSMNTLIAEDGTNSGGGVFSQTNITNNTYQMLTSQVSNWLNSGVNFVDINVNYVGSEDPGNVQDEFEVGVSKKFLNDRITINGEFDVPVGENQNAQQQQQQFLVGDVELIYDITPDGRFKARVFNETNDQLNGQITTTYTQGLGIFYTTDFETFPDLVRKIFGIKPREHDKL